MFSRPVLKSAARHVPLVAVLAGVLLSTTACPPLSEYDRGFLVGFAKDDEYSDGYWDGYDTVDIEPIFYTGNEIPLLTDASFDAGLYDGTWYAYNDGYFTNYRFAFVIGFSEGYDNAFWADFLAFLDEDEHVEFLNGGWSDGYHDGFSEGRVFGAFDFEDGLPFDWLDALLDFESGTDLFFEEVGVGSGEAPLYEYGTDPHDLILKSSIRRPHNLRTSIPSIRRGVGAKVIDPETLSSLRPLTPAAREELNVVFGTSLRSDRELLLTTTWLERIDTYVGDSSTGIKHLRRDAK